ncbi:diguanylate cyclase [Paraglaciecola aquimarina]|uniref:Diguanylate cyclase n=1 Tax=Paraglaciecola aquimarina TaxID=1235557 RepID=A0ABU3T0N3_9ALTE|nr:diguanylate cyclase [Paraglaciecola aquimarina]MDU0355825.1 diguanylate cyclase [Paraglaciecola aquimarina]
MPNRLQFNQYLADQIEAKPNNHFVVATLDVDRFKEINDTLGHEIGDRLLTLIAQRLSMYTEHQPFLLV